MVRKMMKSILILAILLFSVSQVSAQRTDEFNVVMNAAIATNGAQTVTTAAALKTALDGNNGNTPLVLDVRDYNTGYAAGHIPGAISIYYRDLGTASALNSLDSALAAHIAAGKKNEIVTYGNTRHLSRMVAYYLRATQGYTVKALATGFSAWHIDAPGRFIECLSFDANGRGTSPAGCTSNNFPTTVADIINARDVSGEGYANLDNIPGAVTSADLTEVARAAYDARFGDLNKPEYRISARELYDLLDDNGDGIIAGAGDDLSNDPFVLSNRGTTTSGGATGPYDNKGHIPTAVAVDVRDATDRLELITLDNTDFMPTDRTIVHHCWVGVSQQYGGTWYDLLGYE
ncbi:MAG: rhodanese-like domain-containing protein, partial [Candidatus Hydrothermarchaeaceae archaeon]